MVGIKLYFYNVQGVSIKLFVCDYISISIKGGGFCKILATLLAFLQSPRWFHKSAREVA
jgi:hypothetical protein